jgi:hypothetical protein
VGDRDEDGKVSIYFGRYHVYYRGQLLLICRDPERDAARALLARGLKGDLTAYRNGVPALTLHDIERSSKRMATGSEVVAYKAEERQVTQIPMVADRRGGYRPRKAT